MEHPSPGTVRCSSIPILPGNTLAGQWGSSRLEGSGSFPDSSLWESDPFALSRSVEHQGPDLAPGILWVTDSNPSESSKSYVCENLRITR